MTKHEFLTKLNRWLEKLPSKERLEILQDYEEYFDIGLAEGKTEHQIAASLGKPQQIAKELVAIDSVEKVEDIATASNIFRAVWAVIGLGFFNLLIVLGPFLVLTGIILSGWILGISFVAAPLLLLINVAIYPEVFEFFDLFFSVFLTGLGLFIAIGMFFATRAIKNGFVRYLQFNVKFVKGGLKNASY